MSKGERTRMEILEAGLKIWRYDPSKVNAVNIAKLIGKTHPAVYHHFPRNIKKAVASYGVRKGDSVVIVHLILTNDPLVESLSEDERQKHLNTVKELGTPSKVPVDA